MSKGEFTRLRIGVVIDALEVPAWQFGVIAELKASGCAELVIALIAAGDASRAAAVGELPRDEERRPVVFDRARRHALSQVKRM